MRACIADPNHGSKQLHFNDNNQSYQGIRDDHEWMTNGTNGRRNSTKRDQTHGNVRTQTSGTRHHAISSDTPSLAETCKRRPRVRTSNETHGLLQHLHLHLPVEHRRTTSRTPRAVHRTKTNFPPLPRSCCYARRRCKKEGTRLQSKATTIGEVNYETP